jgi:transcriptional regulator with XRE-family HTH domain
MMEEMLKEFKDVFAKTIRVERVRQNVTQEELAEMAGITPQYLCKLENVKKTASINTYLKIASELKLQLKDPFFERKSNSFTMDDTLISLLDSCSEYEKRVCIRMFKELLVVLRER